MSPSALPVEPAEIPTIDFGSLMSAGANRQKALQQLDDAFATYGFIYLSNHGIPEDTIKDAFSWSKRFFSLPHETKQMIAHPKKAEDHRGFAQVGTSVISQGIWDPAEVQKIRDAPPEQREFYEMGNPHSENDRSKNPYPNRWLPEDVLPGFRGFIEKWWDTCIDVELQVMRCLCEILNVPDRDYLAKQQTLDASRSHMTLLHYLSAPLSPLRTQSARRLGAHTDFGQVTLLFQDQVGGLEVHDYEAGIYRPVLPKPETIIIHIGDMLEKQSNGRWKSALHHVTAPPLAMYGEHKEDTVVERYSIAFYAHPDYEIMIKPLPGCDEVGKWRTLEWEPNMTCGDWLSKRIKLEVEDHRPEKVEAPAMTAVTA